MNGDKAKCSGNEIQLCSLFVCPQKGKYCPGILVKTSGKDILRIINTRAYEPHLLIPYNNKQRIIEFIYILLCWPFYYNSEVYVFQPQVGFQLDITVDFRDSDHKCPNIKGVAAEFFPSQQQYKHDKNTFPETALLTMHANTCSLCFFHTLGSELCGTPNPLSYKTGLSVALSTCQ